MRAIDVMVRDVVTVRPDTDVAEATKLLAEHDVSALPVLDQDGNLIGMLSEADLIHRAEIGTEKHRPWWLEAVTGATRLAEEFAKSHGKKVGEVMTTGVISVTEETPLSDIATQKPNVDRFWRAKHHGWQPRRTSLGARRLGGRTQGIARAGRKCTRSVPGR